MMRTLLAVAATSLILQCFPALRGYLYPPLTSVRSSVDSPIAESLSSTSITARHQILESERKAVVSAGDPGYDEFDHCITSADCAFNGECVKRTIPTAGVGNLDPAEHHHHYQQQKQHSPIDPEASGVCKCFPGWKGRTCEVLDLLPVDPQKIGLKLPDQDSSSWGGSVVYDHNDGLYHMFASEIVNGCGLYSWTTNSQVIRAVSDSPYGPYQKVEVILPTFAHDANILRAPTGEYVLYVTALSGVVPKDCRKQPATGGSDPSTTTVLRIRKKISADNFNLSATRSRRSDDVPAKDTYMLWASKPGGPWSEPVMVLNSTIYNTDYWKKYNKTARCDSNLNGIILPSKGKDHRQPFLGLWRRCETDDLLTIPHALVASDWRNASTYKPLVDRPLFVLAGSGAEDPSNIWTTATADGRVAYHAIFHDEQATRCMLGACGGQGRHAVSLDGTTWKYASVNAYDRHFVMRNHSRIRADTRARPHVILSPSNHPNQQQQQPVALSTGLKERDDDGYVYTLVQPLRGWETSDGLGEGR